MIDFSELPKDGIKFEQLVRELFIREGFETHWTGVGPDGGKDLVVTEELMGEFSNYSRKWLISCKHNAVSNTSVGLKDLGNLAGDCSSIGAEGFILVCSTQPASSVVTRLKEIEQKQSIITKFWDGIELEKRLTKPNTFGLIHTFFPESAKNYEWQIYNAYNPSFWAANYKEYFIYLSSRHSNKYPDLHSIESILEVVESIDLYKDADGWHSHELRPRAVYYDDKHCTHRVYLDYLYSNNSKHHIMKSNELNELFLANFTDKSFTDLNFPDLDIRYVEISPMSDSYQPDHKRYYKKFMENFEGGDSRNKFQL